MLLSMAKSVDLNDEYYTKTDTYILMRIDNLNDTLKGKFRHMYSEEYQGFDSISEFIYKLQLLLEQINVPQASTECRMVWKEEINKNGNKTIDNDIEFLNDVLITELLQSSEFFLIHIRYRHHSSWQGDIKWLKKNYTMTFRSVLELLMILEKTMARIKEGNAS